MAHAEQRRAILAAHMHTLDLVPRVHNALRHRLNVQTVGDLVALSYEELRTVRGLGPASLLEIRLALAERGLALAGDPQAEYFLSGQGGTRDGRPYLFKPPSPARPRGGSD